MFLRISERVLVPTRAVVMSQARLLTCSLARSLCLLAVFACLFAWLAFSARFAYMLCLLACLSLLACLLALSACLSASGHIVAASI